MTFDLTVVLLFHSSLNREALPETHAFDCTSDTGIFPVSIPLADVPYKYLTAVGCRHVAVVFSFM